MSKYLLEITYTWKASRNQGERWLRFAWRRRPSSLRAWREDRVLLLRVSEAPTRSLVADLPDEVSAMAAALTVGAAGGATTRTVSLLDASAGGCGCGTRT